MPHTLGFIGGGNMAQAIIHAALASGTLSPDQIIVADPGPDRRAIFDALNLTTTDDNASLIRDAEQIVIAVKPQVFEQIAPDLAAHLTAEHILISIMAGITSAKITQAIEKAAAGAGRADLPGARIVRVMPNTPVLVAQGMTAIALGQHARPDDHALTLKLFQSAGRAILLDESQLDALTAVSGSGPAYVFYLAHAMQQAATDLGLAEHANELIAQTIKGAAALIEQSDDSPEQLTRKVMSPGGTTEAAIHHLDHHHVHQHIIDAIHAAKTRSEDLGQ